MGTSGNFTFYSPSSAAAGSSGDYVKDAFDDITLPATNNSGLTSSASTNPLSYFLNNDDLPKYSAKTLYIKNICLVDDHSKWINNKPTYEITWHEEWAGAKGYCFGDIRLRNYNQGISVSARRIDDGVGVTGVHRRILWILNTTNSTGTADIVTDGSDTGSDITFGTATSDSILLGINKYALFPHQNSSATQNIHDFRLTANEVDTLSIVGCIVYYENTGANIELSPGVTYTDKTKATTTTGSSLALASVGVGGGNTVIYKTSGNTYATSTVQGSTLATTATGTASATTITVTTGHGSSFPIGSGVVGQAGTSFCVATVTSVSTDTLTVSVANAVALSSNTLYKAWQSGATYTINASLFQLARVFDPQEGSVAIDRNGFGNQATGDFYFSDINKKYRVWGDQLAYRAVNGYPCVSFNGATVGFLQLDGYHSACDIEFIGGLSGIIHGTFHINGTPAFGVNESLIGAKKMTVFTDAGPGWHSWYFAVGASFGDVGVARINMYERRPDVSVTAGVLADYDTIVNQANRVATNASVMQLGTMQRVYGDELYFGATWTRGTTNTQAGGVFYLSTVDTSAMTLNYFGKDFAIVGTAGASSILTVDGASVSVAFNALKVVGSEGFHTIQYTHKSGTSVISAVDFLRTKGEMTSQQTILPDPRIDDAIQVVTQGATPQNPKDGTIWAQNPNTGDVWIYLFNKWNKLSIQYSSDDPQVGIVVGAGGDT